jgi:hypothetical protein
MSISFDLNRDPMSVGDSRILTSRNADPIAITIMCFVHNPPPPKYQACPECGTILLNNNESLQITASNSCFNANPGVLRLHISTNRSVLPAVLPETETVDIHVV